MALSYVRTSGGVCSHSPENLQVFRVSSRSSFAIVKDYWFYSADFAYIWFFPFGPPDLLIMKLCPNYIRILIPSLIVMVTQLPCIQNVTRQNTFRPHII